MSQFKVGDFIRNTKYQSEIQAVNQLPVHPEWAWEHWKPRVGEWCWFLTVNSGYELGQYVQTLPDGNHRYRLNNTNSLFNCSNCEPYIGKLPSNVK